MKNLQELEQENKDLQNLVTQLTENSNGIYKNINQLLLWKSSLKVKVNELCLNKDLVGLEGYISDLFPDGFTVVVSSGENVDFYRLPGDMLDIIEWDQKKFSDWLHQINEERARINSKG